MNIEELNEYIKKYVTDDKTTGAIMLNAQWGTGKSYYIINNLIPFLRDKCQKNCIIVSLYGLKDSSEISKNIFMEAKFKKLNEKKLGLNAGKIIAKTVLKGLISFFGLNLELKNSDLNKIYNSINLKNELIIFEDVERSQIDIIEILGYVNNLVEQDKAKVLLVANESEILRYVKNYKEGGQTQAKEELDEKSLKYLKVKEKTISDTIEFYTSYQEAIMNIMNEYTDKYLEKIKNPEFACLVEKQAELTKEVNNRNLRTFIFACQKTVDMFKDTNFEIDLEFYKNVFLGNIIFSLKRKNSENLKWFGSGDTSSELGNYVYPLYKFAYEYICNQNLDIDSIKKANEIFCIKREKASIDKKVSNLLDVIYNYYVNKEDDIILAIKQINEELSGNNVPFHEYGVLINYLIAIKYILRYDEINVIIDNCKQKILEQVDSANKTEISKINFYTGIQLDEEMAIDEFQKFKQQLYERINKKSEFDFSFDYKPESIEKFKDYVASNEKLFLEKGSFAQCIDNDKFVQLLSKCSSYNIHMIRQMFNMIYSISNINDIYKNDKVYLIDLKEKIEKMETEVKNNNKFDKIQIIQTEYFLGQLDEIINSFD